MSTLKVKNLTGLDGVEQNAPVKFTGNKVEFGSGTLTNPGSTVQNVVRMVRSPFTYATGGAYYNYFAEVDCMRTKIKSRFDNSSFFVTMWLNGEPGSTHDWVWFPARNKLDVPFIDAPQQGTNPDGWHTHFFTHQSTLGALSSQWRYYLGSGYTNPGTYNESDYSSTPMATRTMHFIDSPGYPAGTDIWYTNVLMSTGNHTFYVNRCVNYTTSSHETGVSGVRIEEIAGPIVRTELEYGIEEYHFGDSEIQDDRTSANTAGKGMSYEKPITYPSR